jgi:hypothetical protein
VGVSSDYPRGEIGVATAVGAAPAFVAEPKQTRAPPRGYVVAALALAGCIAAVGSYQLSLAGEYGPLPHVHAALVAWIIVAYVGCGLIVSIVSPMKQIRAILLPASMKLLGDWNWYLPKWLEWLPRLEHETTPEAPVAGS